MAKTFIRFQLHKARTDKNGLVPVKVVYELEGKADRKAFLTDKRVRSENWKHGKAVYLNKVEAKKLYPTIEYKLLPLQKEIETLNHDLLSIEKELRSIEKNLLFEGKTFTIADVITIYKARNNEKPQIIPAQPKIFITDFIEEYIKGSKGLINEGTLKTYGSLLNQLQRFGSKKQDKITFAGLDKSKLDELLKHYVTGGYNNSYTSKHFSILKKLIKEAIRETPDLLVNQAFRDYNPTVLRNNDADVISLEQIEFEALLDLDLSDYTKYAIYTKNVKGINIQFNVCYQTLEKVRNLFIFSCTTGFRFSDLVDLKREHIQGEWIRKKQVKGGKVNKIEIPFNAISSYILSLYQNQEKPLPTISNQKANDYIKIIGELAGISGQVEITVKSGTKVNSKIYPKHEVMSMHMGRRVFTSLSLAKGADMQDVMSLTGHKKFASFKRYMHISKKQKEKAMSVWDEAKLNNSNKLKTV